MKKYLNLLLLSFFAFLLIIPNNIHAESYIPVSSSYFNYNDLEEIKSILDNNNFPDVDYFILDSDNYYYIYPFYPVAPSQYSGSTYIVHHDYSSNIIFEKVGYYSGGSTYYYRINKSTYDYSRISFSSSYQCPGVSGCYQVSIPFYTDKDFTNLLSDDLTGVISYYSKIVYTSNSINLDKGNPGYNNLVSYYKMNPTFLILPTGSNGFKTAPDNYSTSYLSYNGSLNSHIDLNFRINNNNSYQDCPIWTYLPAFCDTVYLDDLFFSYSSFITGSSGSSYSITPSVYVSNDGKNYTYIKTLFSGVNSSGFLRHINSLSNLSNSKTLYVRFSFDIPSTVSLDFILSYNKDIIDLSYTSRGYSDESYTSYDMTGKYAIGLIPKNKTGLTNGSLKYLGDFTFYSTSNITDEVYHYSKLLSSSLVKYDFSLSDFRLEDNPILYIINNNYSIPNSTSTIKYLSNLYYIVEFEDEFTGTTSSDNNITYHAPSMNVVEGNPGSGTGSSGGSEFSLTSVFADLPNFISGLSSGFMAIGQCITIAFAGMPDIVQGALVFSLMITILIVAIKLIRG